MKTYIIPALLATVALVASASSTRADGVSYASDYYGESNGESDGESGCHACANDHCGNCDPCGCSTRRHAKRSKCRSSKNGSNCHPSRKGHFAKKRSAIPATGVGYCGDPPIGGHRIISKNQARATALAQPWHGNYYHTEWGSPVALVVPPTAEKQWNMGWGVGSNRLSRTWHQFNRAYPGPVAGAGGVVGEGGGQFLQTPRWPSDTSQFGVYYVRGPW